MLNIGLPIPNTSHLHSINYLLSTRDVIHVIQYTSGRWSGNEAKSHDWLQ